MANKTKLFIAYIDLEKAYDRAWKQITFQITPWTNKKSKQPKSIRQGRVLSVHEFAKMMKRLSEMLQKENLGMWYGRIQISSLLFMDDAVIIKNNYDKFIVALETVERFRKLYKVVLNQGKSKAM